MEPKPSGGEITGQSRGIGEIPLFPLDLVLFPFMPQALHIFEDRYKQMITRCVRDSSPFGMVLLTGVNPDGTVQTSPVGCLARIVRVERLPEGRMNIEVVGEERFRLLDTHEQMPHRTGLTEPVDDAPCPPDVLARLTSEVETVLRDYLTRKLDLSRNAALEFNLPNDPLALGYLAAWILPVENDEKQILLENTDAPSRLKILRAKFEQEIIVLQEAEAAEAKNQKWEPVELSRFNAHRSLN